MKKLKILTIITESVLEHILPKDILKLGAHGYTISDVRGKGSRGERSAGWDNNANIRIEIVCSAEVCEEISSHLIKKYYNDYAMITFAYDAAVQRNDKF